MIRMRHAFGRRAVERLKRSGGTAYDRWLLKEVLAAKLAVAANPGAAEGERERAQEIARGMSDMLETAQALAARRSKTRNPLRCCGTLMPPRRVRTAPRRRQAQTDRRRPVSAERAPPPEPEPPGPQPLEAGLYLRRDDDGWDFIGWADGCDELDEILTSLVEGCA